MAKSARNVSKRKSQRSVASRRSNARVQRYRDKMRAAGFKPVTIWVMDPSRPGFADQVRRETELINASADSQRVLAEIEALTDFDDWK